MNSFSYITYAEDEELFKIYKGLNLLGSRLKKAAASYITGFVQGVANDMGVEGYTVSGRRLCIPYQEDSEKNNRKVHRIIRKEKTSGAGVIVADPSLQLDIPDFNISRGQIYHTVAVIEAVKRISPLMGMDFRTARICVADADSPDGIVAAELLSAEVIYLTLCSTNRDSLLLKTEKYIETTGLSPAVLKNANKALKSCDILFYAGGMDLRPLTDIVKKKMIIANLTPEKLDTSSRFLIVDDVILKGNSKPVISSYKDEYIFLTSRMWEGALLALSGMEGLDFAARNAVKLKRIGQKYGISVTSAISGEKILSEENIYRYR